VGRRLPSLDVPLRDFDPVEEIGRIDPLGGGNRGGPDGKGFFAPVNANSPNGILNESSGKDTSRVLVSSLSSPRVSGASAPP
jgi:hypothetical protein